MNISNTKYRDGDGRECIRILFYIEVQAEDKLMIVAVMADLTTGRRRESRRFC